MLKLNLKLNLIKPVINFVGPNCVHKLLQDLGNLKEKEESR